MTPMLDQFHAALIQARTSTDQPIAIGILGRLTFETIMAEIKMNFLNWRYLVPRPKTDSLEIYGVRVYRSPNLEEGFFFGEEAERI